VDFSPSFSLFLLRQEAFEKFRGVCAMPIIAGLLSHTILLLNKNKINLLNDNFLL